MDTSYTFAALISMWAALKTSIWNGGKLGLFTGATIPTPSTALSDLTEPGYDGYAQKTVATFPLPYVLADDGKVHVTQSEQWQPTGATTSALITGWFFIDSMSNLVYAARLPAPVALGSALDALVIDHDFRLDPAM